MSRQYQSFHSIDNPLAAASTYHLAKLQREAVQAHLADLTSVSATSGRLHHVLTLLPDVARRLWSRPGDRDARRHTTVEAQG